MIHTIGQYVLDLTRHVRSALSFLLKTFLVLFSTRLKVKHCIAQMKHIGVSSFPVIFLTGLAAGLGIALQTYVGMSRFGGQDYIGIVVAIAMTRELAPVLTGLMVMARAGSAMTAELGTMKITEQIDALKTLDINPFQYLVTPRFIAGIIILPMLTVIAMLCGILGGYYYSTYGLGLNSEFYLEKVYTNVELSDITGGLLKGCFFGFIIAWIGSFYGYTTEGGARGVGFSTTKSVVVGCLLILFANYLLSTILFPAY
jgi:phospholipid/cholesterol/gamma-HCH transport system permease protein